MCLDTFVIATNHSRVEKVTVDAPLCGPGRDLRRVAEALRREFRWSYYM